MSRIKGITIELDGDTRGLDKALSDVNKRSRDVQRELRQVDRLLRFNPKNTELMAQRKKLLADQVQNTSEKLKALKRAEKEVQQQFKEGKISEEQYRAFRREIVETESKLKHYQKQLRETKGFVERFGDAMKSAGEKIKSAGDKMIGAGKTLTRRVTTPLLGAAGVAAKIGSDFEAGMSKVAAISGATGSDLEKLTEKAREMGATTMFSASEAAEALNYMALAGWETESMLDGIGGVMDLAAASGEDLAMVSDIVTDGLSAFGLEAKDSARMADVLAAASANANTDVSGLGQAFQYVAPVAGALGFSIEDTSKAIGLMSNAGIKGTKAGTALRTMMTNLAKPTDQMSKEMERLGISLTDNEGNMKSFDEIMDDLRVSFSDLTEEQQASTAATIFGKEAMSGALAIINASEEDYNNLGEAIAGSEGAASEMADTMQDNLQGRLKEMRSVLEDVAITVYDNIQPALESLIQLITRVAQWFGDLSPKMQTAIVVIGGLVAAIGPVLVVIGAMAKGLGTVIAVAGSVIGIAGKLGGIIAGLASPIGIAVAAVGGLIAVGVALWKNWDKVSEFAKNIWGGIKNFFSNTVGSIKNGISNAWNSVSSFTKKTWSNIRGSVSNTVSNMRRAVADRFSGMVNSVRSRMSNVQTAVSNGWNKARNYFKNNDLRTIGKDMIKGLIGGITSMAGALVDKAKGVVGGAINGAKKLLGIASPSRVFMEIGEDTGEGLALGIESMGRRVQSASNKMTEKTFSESENKPVQSINDDVVDQLNKTNELLMSLLKKNTDVYLGKEVVGEILDGEQAKRIGLSGRVAN